MERSSREYETMNFEDSFNVMLARIMKDADHVTRCRRRGCGAAAIAEDGTHWGPEYNGPVNDSRTCDNIQGNCGCCHAEQRLLSWMGFGGSMEWTNLQGTWTLISTLSPCTNCANLIVISKQFKEVRYLYKLNHDQRGIDILESAGITVKKI